MLVGGGWSLRGTSDSVDIPGFKTLSVQVSVDFPALWSDICVVGSRVFGEEIEVPLLGKSLVAICSGSHVLPRVWQKLESVDRGREFPREIQLLIEACSRVPSG